MFVRPWLRQIVKCLIATEIELLVAAVECACAVQTTGDGRLLCGGCFAGGIFGGGNSATFGDPKAKGLRTDAQTDEAYMFPGGICHA